MFHIIWKCFILFLLMLNIFYVPFKLSFDIFPNLFTEMLMDLIPNYAFVIEILLNFNTGKFYIINIIMSG